MCPLSLTQLTVREASCHVVSNLMEVPHDKVPMSPAHRKQGPEAMWVSLEAHPLNTRPWDPNPSIKPWYNCSLKPRKGQ